ncbi:MAG: TIGR04076 family protein [Asgard group archaeon]|nr:TIGR04076 family protein [Asgard group archaeon]
MSYNVKVTVVKQFEPKDIIGEDFIRESGKPITKSFMKENQEFEVKETGDMPEGFCYHAWYGIYKSVEFLRFGGRYQDWTGENTIYGVYPDSIRPVIFKLERMLR